MVDFALKFTLANPDVPGYENARSGQAERGRRNRKLDKSVLEQIDTTCPPT